MTLFRMIFDTLNFIFVVCCYLAIMSTVFSTLFGSLNDFEGGEQYIDTVEAGKYLYMAMLGEYEYTGNENF